MKALQVLFFLTIITFIFCKNTNSDETPENVSVFQDTTAIVDSNLVELFVWVDKLRLRKTPDTKGEILEVLDEGDAVLFLNETTPVSEKIKLRGILYNEPWIKVKTQANIVGWIYRGAIKYEKPKFTVSPEPYKDCFTDFVASKNYEQYSNCRQKIKDRQLKKDKQFITKTEDGFEVKLLSGESRTLQNSIKEDEDFRQYEYLYYIEKLGYFVFRVNFYEAGQFLLIDDKFGYSRPISGFPVPAPDYKHIITTNADAAAGFEFNGIQLYGFSDLGMEILYEQEYEFYEPFLPEWKDEKTVQVHLVPVAFAKNKKEKIITIVQNENGEWNEQ